MNKQSLYLLGGALLASTALSGTVQAAATFQRSVGGNGNGANTPTFTASTAAITPYPLATQVFPASTTAAPQVTIGGSASTLNNEILIDVSPTFATFDVQVSISNAAFSTSPNPTVALYTQSSAAGVLSAIVSSTSGCTVQPSADRISLLTCNVTLSDTSRVDVIGIRGIQFTSANALATAGSSITLSGVTYVAGTSNTIDAITPAAIVTSKSAATDATVQTGTAATIDNNATTPFALLVSSGVTTTTTATLGSVHFSISNAVGTDLSNAFASALSIISQAEVKITHSSLIDSALTNIAYSGGTKVSSQFVGSTASFTVSGASLNTSAIVATFNGTAAIAESTGTLSATVTPLSAGGATQGVFSAFSGTLASLTRGGLSVELNTILPSAMKASYISFLRIANQSGVASTAVLTVRNDATGSLVGSFVTASIPSKGTLSINSVEIDSKLSAAGATLLTSDSYKVTVTGSFNGYVQSLLYNVANQSFADASGFRNGSLTTDP